MKGFVQDIEGIAVKNEEFCQVVYTARHCQLVVMALKPTDFTEDLKKFDVPTLIMHGDDDQINADLLAFLKT